jgi:queuine/archaeosine tRNA-ribosyltransferase
MVTNKLFPIFKGSTYDLREQSAEYIANLINKENATGGLTVGEPPKNRRK